MVVWYSQPKCACRVSTEQKSSGQYGVLRNGCGDFNGTRESGRDEEMDLLLKHKG